MHLTLLMSLTPSVEKTVKPCGFIKYKCIIQSLQIKTAWQCISPAVTVKGVKSCISNAMDGTDDDVLWNGREEGGNVWIQCEEDEGTDCEDGHSDTDW